MTTTTGERADLQQTLAQARHFLRNTASGLTDDQARERSTVSELTVGGLVKHVAAVELQWCEFIEGRGSEPTEPDYEGFAKTFRLLDGETLAGVMADSEAAAARADALLATVDLDETHPLPPAPWFEPGAVRSNRRVFAQLVSEISQHAGHADIIRESIDGQKSMG